MKKLTLIIAIVFSGILMQAQDNPILKKIEIYIMQQHPGEIPASIEITDEKLILNYNEVRNASQAWDWDYVAGTETIYFELIENVSLKEKRKGKRCHVILETKNKKQKVFVFNDCDIARKLDITFKDLLSN